MSVLATTGRDRPVPHRGRRASTGSPRGTGRRLGRRPWVEFLGPLDDEAAADVLASCHLACSPAAGSTTPSRGSGWWSTSWPGPGFRCWWAPAAAPPDACPGEWSMLLDPDDLGRVGGRIERLAGDEDERLRLARQAHAWSRRWSRSPPPPATSRSSPAPDRDGERSPRPAAGPGAAAPTRTSRPVERRVDHLVLLQPKHLVGPQPGERQPGDRAAANLNGAAGAAPARPTTAAADPSAPPSRASRRRPRGTAPPPGGGRGRRPGRPRRRRAPVAPAGPRRPPPPAPGNGGGGGRSGRRSGRHPGRRSSSAGARPHPGPGVDLVGPGQVVARPAYRRAELSGRETSQRGPSMRSRHQPPAAESAAGGGRPGRSPVPPAGRRGRRPRPR